MSALPAEYIAFRDRSRNDLKQILKVDQHTVKVPMHAVALLVMVAYEVLGKFRDQPGGTKKDDTHWLFAKVHKDKYQIDPEIGARIFKALRHGLAHRYGHYPVRVTGLGDIRLVLFWMAGGPHLKASATAVAEGHQWLYPIPKLSSEPCDAVCVNVWSLWEDLDGVFAETDVMLASDPEAGERYRARVATNGEWQARKLDGSDPAVWRTLLSSRRLEAES